MKKESINTESVPAIYVFYEGKYYKHDMQNFKDTNDVAPLLHLMNRLLVPLVSLNTEEEIEAFLDANNELDEQTRFLKKYPIKLAEEYERLEYKTRVIAFIFDKEE